jgi:hypothetical protein
MTKIIVVISILVLYATCLTNKEILQLGLNGAFEQNKLPDPVTIVPCID